MEPVLTIMPAGGRGCGSRKKGGCYACVAMSEEGTHLSHFLLDPPVPYLNGASFQGVHPAPEYITAGWDHRTDLVLMDWVGETHYASPADFVEEVRRYGMSRRIPKSFPFETIKGRRVWLALVHAKAAPEMDLEGFDAPWKYNWCHHCPTETNDPVELEHWRRCLYHDWPIAYRIHGQSARENAWIEMPWGLYCPLDMVRHFGPYDVDDDPVLAVPESLPDETYPHPAFFAILPVTHLEAVEYVEEDVAEAVEASGLPLYVTEE